MGRVAGIGIVHLDVDAGLTADVEVILDVQHINHKPYWTQDPITLTNAKENQAYNGTVSEFAKDPDIPNPGDTLSFLKVDGPAWLQISPTGVLTGTPTRQDVGLNEFKVRVTDKPRREGSDNDARNEITDQRRQPQTRRDHPEHDAHDHPRFCVCHAICDGVSEIPVARR